MSSEALPLPVHAPVRAAAPPRLRVCHVMSADLWAGAEVQVATVASYLVGVPDVDHLLSRLFHRRRDLCLPDGAPSRWRTLIDFLKSTKPGIRDQVVSREDPGPFLHELRQYARNLSASVVRSARRRLVRARVRGLRLSRTSIAS